MYFNPNLQWFGQLEDFFQSDKWQSLQNKLALEAQQTSIYPVEKAIFHAFELCDYNTVRVVIIGQDPYHGPNQAMGLSFSVPQDQKLPPSLRNMFQELHTDCGITRTNPDLSDWASQGVLLLNSILTVREQAAGSHQGYGWEQLTELVIKKLNDAPQPIVFVLWGKFAQRYAHQLTNQNHLVLTSAHPSPLSAYRGFFGSRPFSQINAFLVAHECQEIQW